jgi:cytochrome c oxidase subunit II
MTGRTGRGAACILLLTVLGATACSAPEPGVDRGRDVWTTCVPCHGSAGQGNVALGAPSIAGLPEWYVVAQLQKFEAGWRGAHPMDTVGIRMKSMARALDLEGDRESVAAYLATLPRIIPAVSVEGGDPELGRLGYAGTCLACHGEGGVGVEAVGGPPLLGQDDWYLLSQFRKFRTGWRGAHPEDVFGQIMAANAVLYEDEVVLDIIAYIRTLQAPGSADQ